MSRKFENKERKCLEIILTFKLLLEKENYWLTPFPTQGVLSKAAQLAGYVEVSSKICYISLYSQAAYTSLLLINQKLVLNGQSVRKYLFP